MQKLIILVGPTASGKSALGIQLAKKYGGEIISADSRQVYTGLNIGTGKVTTREMQRIPHHLLDVANPKKRFDVSQFKKLGEKSIKNISKRGVVPIIVGGTGFYIDALVYDIVFPEVAPDVRLRTELSKLSNTELIHVLISLDPERAETIDTQNPVRLIRAIEIAKSIGKTPPLNYKSIYNVLFIGLTLDKVALQKKIHGRLMLRIKIGMVLEVKKLHADGLSWKRLIELGLEYRYIALYLQNKISKEEMITQLEREIIQYAKRQMTWFKRNKNIHWFNVEDSNAKKNIDTLIGSFLKV